MNSAKRAYDQIEAGTESGVTRGALQANLRALAHILETQDLPGGNVCRKAAERLDIYEQAAFDELPVVLLDMHPVEDNLQDEIEADRKMKADILSAEQLQKLMGEAPAPLTKFTDKLQRAGDDPERPPFTNERGEFDPGD